MKYTVQLPTENVHAGDEFVSAEGISEMARAAEDLGFDACFVTDHPMPEDHWLSTGGHHSLDPFVALSFAATATRTLLLQTHVLVLAYRNPFLAAKSSATLDVLSGGRLILGVATGYLEGEFAALGAEFAARNELADEALVAMKRAFTEDGVTMRGRAFHATGNTMQPRPAQKPHPPLWVGGNSRRAIRRAVEHGDGWLPFPAPARLAGRVRTAAIESVDDLRRLLQYARDHAASVGRTTPLEVCFVPFEYQAYEQPAPDPAAFRETVTELEELGVTWLSINVPCRTRSGYLEKIRAFAGIAITGR